MAIKDGTHGTYTRIAEGRPLLSAKNVFPDGIHISDDESLISQNDHANIVSSGFPAKGDILVTCVGTIGRAFVYDLDYPMAFQRSVAFLRLNERAVPDFYKWYIESAPFQDQLKSVVKSSAQGGVYMGDLVATEAVLPPVSEQVQITRFLDHETAKIDSLIREQERLIKLLQEKRQAVISHAVIKGTDPDIPMKDSGLECLGKVPAHWEVMPVKFLLSLVTSGSRGWAEFYSDEGDLFFRIANLTRDSIWPKLKSTQHVIPPKDSEGARARIQIGDILVSITADLGSVCVADESIKGGYVSQHVALARPQAERCYSEWLAFLSLGTVRKSSY